MFELAVSKAMSGLNGRISHHIEMHRPPVPNQHLFLRSLKNRIEQRNLEEPKDILPRLVRHDYPAVALVSLVSGS